MSDTLLLNETWTADVVGRMHRCKISNDALAQECGYSAPYLSTVLNGRKEFMSDKAKEETKERILNALDRIESRILKGGEGNA